MPRESSDSISVDSSSFIGKESSYKILALVLFSAYLMIILSTSIAMVHNSPLNTITNQNDNGDAFTNASVKLEDANKNPGITFGNVNEPVKDQTRMLMGYVITTIPFSILVIPFSFILLAIFYYAPDYFEQNFNLPSGVSAILTLLASVIIYTLGVLAILEFIPEIHFITSGWDSKSVLWAVLNTEIVPQFFLFMLFQAVIVNSIPFVWTRPIMPQYYNRYSNSNQALLIHLENWRKYGSWMATVFGGILLTSVLVFITDLSLFGSLFVQHALALIGGVVAFDLAFVIFKLQRIECEIAES